MESLQRISKIIQELRGLDLCIQNAIRVLEQINGNIGSVEIPVERAATSSLLSNKPKRAKRKPARKSKSVSGANASSKTKICRVCGIAKPLDGGFTRHKECADGYMATCKDCRKTNALAKRAEASALHPELPGQQPPKAYGCRKGCDRQFRTMFVRDDHELLAHKDAE